MSKRAPRSKLIRPGVRIRHKGKNDYYYHITLHGNNHKGYSRLKSIIDYADFLEEEYAAQQARKKNP